MTTKLINNKHFFQTQAALTLTLLDLKQIWQQFPNMLQRQNLHFRLCEDLLSCGASDVFFPLFQSSHFCFPNDDRGAASNWLSCSFSCCTSQLITSAVSYTASTITTASTLLFVPFNSPKGTLERWIGYCSKMPVHFSRSSSGLPQD